MQVLGAVAVLRKFAGLGDQAYDLLVSGRVFRSDLIHLGQHTRSEPFDTGVGKDVEACFRDLANALWRGEKNRFGERLLLYCLEMIVEQGCDMVVISIRGWELRKP